MKKLITFVTALLSFPLAPSCSSQKYTSLDVIAFSRLIAKADVQLVDVRTPSEFAEGHLVDALLIDVGNDSFMEEVTQQLDKSRPVAVYCRTGRRSGQAADKLASNGYEVVNLKGGISAWKGQNMPVTTDSYEIDCFKTPNGKTVKFVALTHSSIRMMVDSTLIMIDPVSAMGGKQINYEVMGKANYILVTHEHGDHFDKKALSTLSDESTRIVLNRRCADQLGRGEVMANGDKLTLNDDISIEAVPAYNYTEGHQQFHPKDRDNGYIITVDGLRIYIAGDTEDIPEMKNISNIDIAFMPCNQPYTMTTQQLCNAARTVRPKVLFPYHYSQTDVSGLPAQLKDDGIDVRIRAYQ